MENQNRPQEKDRDQYSSGNKPGSQQPQQQPKKDDKSSTGSSNQGNR